MICKQSLECEVGRVQSMHLGLGQVIQVSFSTFTRKENVVLSPEYDCLWLTFP